MSYALYIPAVHDGDNAGLPLGNSHEGRFGHVEVVSWGVTPATIVGGLGPIGWTDVGGCYSGDDSSITC